MPASRSSHRGGPQGDRGHVRHPRQPSTDRASGRPPDPLRWSKAVQILAIGGAFVLGIVIALALPGTARGAEPPTVADDVFIAAHSGELTVDAENGVLINDGGTGLEAELWTEPAAGTVELAADGSLTYTRTAMARSDTFRYLVTDVDGSSTEPRDRAHPLRQRRPRLHAGRAARSGPGAFSGGLGSRGGLHGRRRRPDHVQLPGARCPGRLCLGGGRAGSPALRAAARLNRHGHGAVHGPGRHGDVAPRRLHRRGRSGRVGLAGRWSTAAPATDPSAHPGRHTRRSGGGLTRARRIGLMDQSIDLTAIDAAIEQHADGAFRFLERLIAAPSTVGQEQGALEVFAQELSDLGFAIERIPVTDAVTRLPGAGVKQVSYDGRYNVLARRPGDRARPSLLLNGHIDVVPAESPQLWTTLPFQAARRDGWMFGRGAGDMKCGFAMGALALRAVLETAPDRLTAPLSFLAAIEEECTGNGTLAAAAAGVTADAVVLLEPTNLEPAAGWRGHPLAPDRGAGTRGARGGGRSGRERHRGGAAD